MLIIITGLQIKPYNPWIINPLWTTTKKKTHLEERNQKITLMSLIALNMKWQFYGCRRKFTISQY